MSLKDKLARLDPDGKPRQPEEITAPDWITNLENELQIRTIQQERSFFFLKENYSPVYQNEDFQYFQQSGFQCPALQLLLGETPLPNLNFRQFIFLDLETTGLAGGTGTYAFLIGLAHIEVDHIVVRQYLLPDFSHEWLMLQHVARILETFPFTVTFNGKAFDIPLLNNRYLLNRMISPLEEKHHLDLLHASRRIWRYRLPSCELQTLEQHVLGNERMEDVPGELIPYLYFEFIKKRDALILRDVLEHNFYDLVNLVLLAMRLARIAENPAFEISHPLEFLSLGNYFFQNKQYELARPLLEFALNHQEPLPREQELKGYFQLALLHKRQGQSSEAKQFLWKLLERNHYHPTVIEELAKFYEHEDKDYAIALEIVERGIQYLETVHLMNQKDPLLRYLPGLRHRLNRLKRKKAKSEG